MSQLISGGAGGGSAVDTTARSAATTAVNTANALRASDVTSAALVGTTLTLTRTDASTYDVDLSGLSGSSDAGSTTFDNVAAALSGNPSNVQGAINALDAGQDALVAAAAIEAASLVAETARATAAENALALAKADKSELHAKVVLSTTSHADASVDATTQELHIPPPAEGEIELADFPTISVDYAAPKNISVARLDEWGRSRKLRRVFNHTGPGGFDFNALGYPDRTAVFVRNISSANGIDIVYGAGGAIDRFVTRADGTDDDATGQDAFNVQPGENVVIEKDGAQVFASIWPGKRITMYENYAAAVAGGFTPYDGLVTIQDKGEIFGRKTNVNSRPFPAGGNENDDWWKIGGSDNIDIVRYTADGLIEDKDHRAIFETGANNMTLPVSTQDRLIQIISEGPATIITADGTEQFTGAAGPSTDSILNVNETFQWATILGRGAAAGWSQYVGLVATAQSVGAMVDFSESPGPGDAASFSLDLTNSGANLRFILTLTCSNGTNFSPPLNVGDGVNRWWYDFDHTTGVVNVRRFGAFAGGSVRGVALYS